MEGMEGARGLVMVKVLWNVGRSVCVGWGGQTLLHLHIPCFFSPASTICLNAFSPLIHSHSLLTPHCTQANLLSPSKSDG